ncbi:MAG: ATP-binding cassette domain-containing protein [Verrucomicrobiota bacterium]
MPLLQVEKLNTWFYPERSPLRARGKPLKAVHDVSLSIEEGSTIGLIGNLGCGKSTLAQTLTKLIPATSGSVQFQGREILRLSQRAFRPLRKHIQIIFQDARASFDPQRPAISTLAETVRAHHPKLSPTEIRALTYSLLDYVEISAKEADRLPTNLDHGQAERLSLARVLSPYPKLLIVDDTLHQLDARQQRAFLDRFTAARSDYQLSALFIGHEMPVLAELADFILVMSRGRIVESAPTEHILKDPQHEFTKKLIESTVTLD